MPVTPHLRLVPEPPLLRLVLRIRDHEEGGMSTVVYQQSSITEPSFYLGETESAGHYAVVHLAGHDLRIGTANPDDLDRVAAVLTEAAAALREAKRIAGES
jgi:hypothetical protein